MDIKQRLQSFKAWQWAIIIVLGVGIGLWIKGRVSSGSSSSTVADDASTGTVAGYTGSQGAAVGGNSDPFANAAFVSFVSETNAALAALVSDPSSDPSSDVPGSDGSDPAGVWPLPGGSVPGSDGSDPAGVWTYPKSSVTTIKQIVSNDVANK